MAIRPIVEVPDPRLREISRPVEGVDDELRTLVADMFETMYAAPGIGLAAIQVGVPQRVLVTYRPAPEGSGTTATAGDAVAIELLPNGYTPK